MPQQPRQPERRVRGVLGPPADGQPFRLSLCPPAPALAELVEHYWVVRWDLPDGAAHTQHTLPHPAVHLVAERGRTAVYGVTTGRFARELTGTGRAFGIRFRPAGFRPFLGAPVSSLTDRTIPVAEVFGDEGDTLAERLLALDDDRAATAADAFLAARRPPPDPLTAGLNALVARTEADRGVTRVDQLAGLAGVGARTLQRRFRDHVGVTPKWVVQRYRLHEAAARLTAGDDLDLAGLARDLGYFDQAHFANDFRAVVGATPGRYARSP